MDVFRDFTDSWLRCIDCGKRMVIVPGSPELDDQGGHESHAHECLSCGRIELT